MISTCPEFRVACTSSFLIHSCPLCSTENSCVIVTSDLPVASFRVRLFILTLLILAAIFDMNVRSFFLKTFSSFGFQVTSLSVLFLPPRPPVLAPPHLPRFWSAPGLPSQLYSTVSILTP